MPCTKCSTGASRRFNEKTTKKIFLSQRVREHGHQYACCVRSLIKFASSFVCQRALSDDVLVRCRRRAELLFFALDRFRAVLFFFVAARFRGFLPTRSGSFALPVSRFHSSKVSGEISPLTSSSANLRRCAWLLNGIEFSRPGARAGRSLCDGQDTVTRQKLPHAEPVILRRSRRNAGEDAHSLCDRCRHFEIIRSGGSTRNLPGSDPGLTRVWPGSGPGLTPVN